jgi:hypothetical protein
MQRQNLLVSFILKGLGVMFFNYPTLLVVLVVVESSMDLQAIVKLCFFHGGGPMLACLELHIVFFGVFQFLLLMIHIGRPNFCLICLFELVK